MYKYKLIRRNNPQDKSAQKKWHAAPVSGEAQNVRAMARAATENTMMSPVEMEAAIYLLADYARRQLRQGHAVRLCDLGTLRLSFKSEGVDDPAEFNATTMIHSPRIIFRPGREFRESVLTDLKYQSAGILDDGISYSTLAGYRRAKGMEGRKGAEAPEESGDGRP